MSNMSETQISAMALGKEKDAFSSDETITITARFSLTGELRDVFTEKNWTEAYDAFDNTIKLKYKVKLAKDGLRKHELGKSIDTYRKAAIFWTRNPKLVNPMKERRVWVQVAKNFEPFIALTEEDVKKEFFDFEEKFTFKASELGNWGIIKFLQKHLHPGKIMERRKILSSKKEMQKTNQTGLK